MDKSETLDACPKTGKDRVEFRNKNKRENRTSRISYFEIFRYASGLEKCLLGIGISFGILCGFIMPVVIIFYGEFATLLIDRNSPNKTVVTPTIIVPWFNGGRQTDNTAESNREALKEDALAFGIGFCVIALCQFVVSFIFVASLNYSALLQTARLRRKLFKAVLRQDMTWYDCNNANGLPTKLLEGMDKVQEGIGEKIGIFLSFVMEFVSSVTLAFFYGWKLTLVMLTCAPVLTVSQALVCKIQTSLKAKEMEAYGKAGSVAEEVFSSVKTVMAFCAQKKEIERYNNELVDSEKAGIRRGFLSGLGGGLMWFFTYSCYALAFWYGVTLILESRSLGNFEYTPSVLLISFFGVLVGAIHLGMSTPHLEAFSAARGAADSVFSILGTTSKIDCFDTKGKILDNFTGDITFDSVSFRYPSRFSVEVLKKVNLNIKKGEVVALVGASGSGKSTVLQLLQRFYDPVEGSVQLDGVSMRDLNVKWMRQQFGIVGQEPSLFATTIYENIKYGWESATRRDVEEAAKLANAHDFIMKLPDGYETVLGAKGSLISGGQKQRIAIARALVRNPKILLLDEATSALDVESEAKVQEALDKAVKGRTTIVVTHKLPAIAKADRIVVLSEGRVVEDGNHEELLNLKGHYFRFLEMHKTNERESTGVESLGTRVEKEVATVEIGSDAKEGQSEVDDNKEATQKLPQVSFLQILGYNKPEWWAILLGSISTFVVAANCPALSIVFGELYGILSDTDPDYIMSHASFYSVILFGLGCVIGLATFLQSYMINYGSVKLTSRLRQLGFAAILNQETGWFDEKTHQTGALCSKLASDASDVQGATGSRIALVVQSFSTLLFGAIAGFMYSWKMTVVTLMVCPIIFFGMYYEGKVIEGQSILEKESVEKATKISLEAISNIRTVVSLGNAQLFLDRYSEALLEGERKMKAKAKLRGVIYALGASSTYLGYGLSLWYGGILTADGELHYKDVIKVSESLLFGMWILGQTLAFAPSYSQAKISAARLFDILDRRPKLKDGQVEKKCDWSPEGRVKFSGIDFAYPTRPDVQILKGLDLDIVGGRSVALVGPSGCGKSTILQLLQRLYDPNAGRICLDDEDISNLKLSTLRHQIGIVSQEPVLFDRTLAENIAYGDTSRTVTESEIIDAAKRANIHNFIASLPLGYETRAGAGGGHLSGGQKQRIAIARALIRNPKILLLDEATSALDAESEAVAQSALDSASTGRTTITVSHRARAVAKANAVYRIADGRVSCLVRTEDTDKSTQDEQTVL